MSNQKASWEKIYFNAQSIVAETDNAVLIKMPNNSQYKGYCFWHPRKLVREQGGKGYHYTFAFTYEFSFRLKKFGQGRYNFKDVISEVQLTVSEMKAAFGIVNENVHQFVEQETENLIEKNIETVTVEKHIPAPIEPKNTTPAPELVK